MREPGARSKSNIIVLSRRRNYATERSPLPLIAAEGSSHRVQYVNSAFCKLVGKERKDLIGSSFSSVVPEGADNHCLELMDRVYLTGKSERLLDQEHRHTASNLVYWTYNAWAILDRENHPTEVMMQITDTTETALTNLSLEKVNEEIKKINEALLISSIRVQEFADTEQERTQAKKLESIGRLAGGLAHDFNNLLTVITGYTQLATEILTPEHEVQIYLKNIERAAERAAKLTAQLLAYARKQIIAPRVVNINTLIYGIDKMIVPLIGDNIQLDIKTNPHIGLVSIDPGQFEQLLINLVVNASDSMPTGGHLAIHTSERMPKIRTVQSAQENRADRYVLLSVSDTGEGISEKVMGNIFEPFYTTKAFGKGTGLGLATCYSIVKQAGGSIEVESELGIGSTFNIFFPVVNGVVEAPRIRENPVLPKASGVIFLVEDERMVREIGFTSLTRQGYTVIEAEDGVSALQKINAYEGEIDLLVTDVMMPYMGGKELAQHLRLIRPQTKVLFVSGYTDAAFNKLGVLDPDIAFMQKPYSVSDLLLKVYEVLNSSSNELPTA